MQNNNQTTGKGNGLRFNEGKPRYDLVNPEALEDMVKVLTYGANKYVPRNWEQGLSWTSVLASLKRHIAAFERGEDIDNESGMLHIAHAACNIHYLNAYYHFFPQGDDRVKRHVPRIGLDIDEVLCDFVGGWTEKFMLETPKFWRFDRLMVERFNVMRDNNELNDFYLQLKPKISPDDIPFEPCCYITSRPVEKHITEQWLDYYHFPCAKVVSLDIKQSKVEAAKQNNVEVFVDDSYENFKELNDNGVLCYLFDRPHNQRFDVGHLRIKTLKDMPWFKKYE